MITDLLTEDDIFDIHGFDPLDQHLTLEDIKLAKKVPIVVSYELIDLGETDYHFSQEFTAEDTYHYFDKMQKMACRTIDEIIDISDHTWHFEESCFKGNLKKELMKRFPGCENDPPIVYHFALYTDPDRADRKTGKRSPRIYFMLSKNGVILPLFFDPYHELNPTNY